MWHSRSLERAGPAITLINGSSIRGHDHSHIGPRRLLHSLDDITADYRERLFVHIACLKQKHPMDF